MAAGLLTARLFLVCVLSEVSRSSALPTARSSLHPRAWQDGRGEQDADGSLHPFQYMTPLRRANPNLHLNVHDQFQVRAPRPYRPRSNAPTHRPVDTPLLQPRAHRNGPLAKPRSFDLSLQIPFAHKPHGASWYRPSGFYIHNSFNDPLRSHEASKPGYQFSISVPPRDPDRREHHSERPQRPEHTGSDHQEQQHLTEARPSTPWHSSRRLEQTGRDGPLEEDLEFPENPSRPRYPPKYVDPYRGYYSSWNNPAWHDYGRHNQGHYHGPRHGPHWSRMQHSPDSWSD